MLDLGPVAWQAECDPYCRAVLARHYPETRQYERVEDIDEHAQKVGIICGGFPCQDISIAGGRAGIDGPRSGLWREFLRVVRLLRPPLVFVENVPELAAHLGRVLGPLAELGFDAEWGVFSAAEVGAPHRRERMFVLAYAPGIRREDGFAGGLQQEVATTPRSGADVADTDRDGQLQPEGGQPEQWRRAGDGGETLADTVQPGRPRSEVGTYEGGAGLAEFGGWQAEPDVGRVVDGPTSRLDARRRRARLRSLGNAVVPQQGAHAFVTLASRAGIWVEPEERAAC